MFIKQNINPVTTILIIMLYGVLCFSTKIQTDQTKTSIILPQGFVYLKDYNSRIKNNLRYSTTDNFGGRIVPNYNGKSVICTKEAAIALDLVQKQMQKHGLGLVVYDAYRPASSTGYFVQWANNYTDVNQTSKSLYYPYIQKNQIIPQGYIAEKSGHNRGSTVDLTIIRLGQQIKPIKSQTVILKDGKTIINIPTDNTIFMGSGFDLFHEVSHHGTNLISKQATNNRQFLRGVMQDNGFKILPEEWWHYTLVNQPFPDTYFDFPIVDSVEQYNLL